MNLGCQRSSVARYQLGHYTTLFFYIFRKLILTKIITSTIVHVSNHSVRDPSVRNDRLAVPFKKIYCSILGVFTVSKMHSWDLKLLQSWMHDILLHNKFGVNLECMKLFGRVIATYVYLTVKKILKWTFFFVTVDRRLVETFTKRPSTKVRSDWFF